ncbi:acetate/propionate family kinase [Clostridium oryzae]|uniref:Acetate kinase n=1 Tax=Clostridium oryzae TaxID=1450648 RepID=A0A1V4IPD8_9CLOT|nr:acetate kinase [Clostridium oryzae]OPJ61773.1 acetate kinase [Clostridium oryzae]
MKVLVINCGSSSLKYQLFDMEDESVLAKGLVERIGNKGSNLTQKVSGRENYVVERPLKDHKDAIKLVVDTLTDKNNGVIGNMSEISAVGHRVVHGGEKYAESVLIDDEVMKAMEECIKLAPLHNPPNIIGIKACQALMPNVPMVAVFDTSFHQTMSEEAYMYALPYEFYQKFKIRRYGFHGTSHKYVSKVAAEMLGKKAEDLKMITCHLGNGGSITAVKNGKSIDTSMGFTPLEGIVMGTRCGNIDPAILTYLINEEGYTTEELDNILNKKSGLLGLSGESSDFRDINAGEQKGNERCKLALKVYIYKIKQFIGSYVASMNGLDCLVFTAGIGENAYEIRERVCENMEYLGIKIDKEKNRVRGVAVDFTAEGSRVKVLAIPTDEELMIARDTVSLI